MSTNLIFGVMDKKGRIFAIDIGLPQIGTIDTNKILFAPGKEKRTFDESLLKLKEYFCENNITTRYVLQDIEEVSEEYSDMYELVFSAQ